MKLDGKTIQESIKQLIEEYKFDPHQVLEIVKMGIKSAYKKDYLPSSSKHLVHITIAKDGEIKVYKELEVVEEVEEKDKEILLEDAVKYKADVSMGESIFIDITPNPLEFSRISVQAAAQTIKQSMKKIERERFFEKFKDKQGEILKAKVIKTINDNVVLDMDGATVLLPSESQIPNRIYVIGEEILVLLRQISKGQGGIVLDITQSSTDFIETILRKTVPELEEGTVKILRIVRSAGKKSKVLVSSDDERVDPVGVFMGQGGDRIHSILSVLDGEKIEFVHYNENPEIFIKESLKPAKLNKVSISGKVAKVSLPQDQKALAIGKQAVNIKLASQLTGYKIQIEE